MRLLPSGHDSPTQPHVRSVHWQFRALMHSIGTKEERLHPHFIEHFLAVADRDHDGSISFDEFLLVHAQLRRFDELLHAPKRPPTAADDVDPSIASKLKRVDRSRASEAQTSERHACV